MRLFSADNYFMNPITGAYEFDPKKLGEAHGQCMRGFLLAAKDAHYNQAWMKIPPKHHVTILRGIPGSGKTTWALNNQDTLDIVVDNTNIGAVDVAPYAAVAAAYGIQFEIVTFIVEPSVAHASNVHGVPLDSILSYANRLANEHLMPWWPQRDVVLRGRWD